MPRALLIYPEFPPSYWSAKYALQFINRKASMPPLGLLTLAAMFPKDYELRLIDMNVQELADKDLEWADYAFISAMVVQRDSFHIVASRCKAKHIPTIAGGPYATSYGDAIKDIDYLVRGEVEGRLADFLEKLEEGVAPAICDGPEDVKGIACRPDLKSAPIPRYDLVNLRNYGATAVQFSRGCPFECEFCDITTLFGRVPRTKSNQQILAELDNIYVCGWRGSVFFVDDNFIGNKARARQLLPDIIKWQKDHRYPFFFYTEASVNLSTMPDLMDEMAVAGFDMVFLGLETPNPNALQQIGKGQNIKKNEPDYLLNAVRAIQAHGLEVTAGFIIGLDGDDISGFDAQVDFVQKAGIPTAMVGLLTALKGTRLYNRYQIEGRLTKESNGNNLSAALNFRPILRPEVLIAGYKKVLATLYDRSLTNYFERCFTLIKHWNRVLPSGRVSTIADILAFLRSLLLQGLSRQGPAYLRFLARVIFIKPILFPEAIRLAIMGYHYEKVTRQQLLVDDFKCYLEEQLTRLRRISALSPNVAQLQDLRARLDQIRRSLQSKYSEIGADFQKLVDSSVESFNTEVSELVELYLKSAQNSAAGNV